MALGSGVGRTHLPCLERIIKEMANATLGVLSELTKFKLVARFKFKWVIKGFIYFTRLDRDLLSLMFLA